MTARPVIAGSSGAVTGDLSEPLLTPAEAAAAFRVDVRTLARWARQGKIASIKTPGGARRYPQSEISRLLGDVRGPLMATGEVAAAFGVDPKTVTRWAQAGKLDSFRTAGGQHRFLVAQVHALQTAATACASGQPPR